MRLMRLLGLPGAVLLVASLVASCDDTAPADAPATTSTAAAALTTTTTTTTTTEPAATVAPTVTTTTAALPATPPPEASEANEDGPPEEIEPFDDAATVAEWLRAAETALADPATPPDEFPRWAWVHQQAYRDLAVNPAWQEAARNDLPADLRPAFDLNIAATAQLGRLTEPQPELPDWRIVAPPPVDELLGYYAEAEAEFGVPWNVLAAIHHVETRFGRIQGDSHAGAQGPMQFMPSTWDAYGEGDVTDPRDAIMAAGRYLAASGAPDDMRRALFAYNRSERYVDAILAYAEAIDHYDHYLDVYHQWRVYYRTVDGTFILEEGYGT